ncbi:MAG TPA: malonyl-CoA synthase [Casimicrobiaceae bacterium]|nr:malonyl-CoA synthase [Casimicrobiaceae bacterium]
MNANLYTFLERHFSEAGDQPCLVVPGGRVLSYDELDSESARIANVLVAAGCRPGDRVAAQVDKHWQIVPLYLATLRAGLVYLPLNTAYQRAELDYFFADATPRVIVCAPEKLGVVETLSRGATVLTLDPDGGDIGRRAMSADDRFETVERSAEDLAAILYPSGTTGRSKGAMLTHRNLGSNALTLVEQWGFTGSDTLLHALPIYHVHGLFVAIHCVLLSGSRMLWLPRFDACEVASLLPRATAMMGVPTFYTRLLAEPTFTRESCAGVRVFIAGSAPLLPETFRAFEERTGHRILERYGMTETGMNASNPLDGARVPGTVGLPLPGVDVRVVDEHGKDCERETIGQIEIRGPNVCAGYLNQPDKTAESMTADGWFRSGDIGSFDANGYLIISGRATDMIISGGLNVYPKEIEERLDAMNGVVESAVIGVPDVDFGEAVVAVLAVPRPHELTEASVVSALKSEIARYKVPKRVYFVDELPRNAMGKVQKGVLRERVITDAK